MNLNLMKKKLLLSNMLTRFLQILIIIGTLGSYHASFCLTDDYTVDGTFLYNSIDYQVWRLDKTGYLINPNDPTDMIEISIPVCRKPGLMGFPNPSGLLGTYDNNQQATCFVYPSTNIGS